MVAAMIYGAVVGLCVGSFLNAAVPRFPHLKTLLTQRSYCPRCRTQIKGYDNVPLFSWLALRGQCRSCALPIPLTYPLVEIGCGALGALVGGLLTGAGVALVWVVVSAAAVTALTVVWRPVMLHAHRTQKRAEGPPL
jgi:leader peptidase (prepilin peptidase)/N-methyltransferase